MLTDYHLHLRLDDLDATAAEHFTAANVERYREAAAERGIVELGVSEHVHRFAQALEVWGHPFWREYAHDDLDGYCDFVRGHTDLRLGIEADFVPGAEDRMANLLQARDFDYVVGSVHFLRNHALDMDDHDVWSTGRSAEEIWGEYFRTLGEAARSGLFDILAHPDLVKVWGRERPLPEGDLRRYYELAIDGIAESGIAVEVSTAGLRKRAKEIYPAPAFLEMCLQAGAPVALSSDAHRPQEVGAGYDQALELLDRLGVGELCVFDRRERRLEPIGLTDADAGGPAPDGGGQAPPRGGHAPHGGEQAPPRGGHASHGGGQANGAGVV
jgi:histidinol-phosphatase (PHP family)